MYGAGKLTDYVIRGNTQGKLNNYVSGVMNSNASKLDIGKVAGGFDKIYKSHNRNVALGMGGLALAGAGGYAIHKYLQKKKRNKENMNREQR